ncbi:arrestin domain-containing protein 3-like [Synchiropus picturatus]
MTISKFSIEYDAINSKNIFTNGDTINGRIIVEASKETKVQTLTFIASGQAEVRWADDDEPTHWAHIEYYKVLHDILSHLRNDGSDIISKGRHVFPFNFQIPDTKMPSSFKDDDCTIIHKVKAKLKQSMRLTKRVNQHFNFVSAVNPGSRRLMDPQYGSADSTLRSPGSESVTMKVHTERMGYMQGEGIMVTVEVNNTSSRSVKPKLALCMTKEYKADDHSKYCTSDVLKDKLDSIPSGSKEVVKKVITVPSELRCSITNCPIFQLEYRLKVTLKRKHAKGPIVTLPIVVMPWKEQPPLQPNQTSGIPNQAPLGGYPNQPYPTGSHAPTNPPFGNSNQVNSSPGLPSITSPVGPPPPYSAVSLYPSPRPST